MDYGAAAGGRWARSDQGEHCSTPIWRENRDVRRGLWPKPWMAKAKVLCAAIRPTR
jgi:hypothetical protein